MGNRFPVQFLSSVLYFLAFIYLWKSALHFHFTGKISALGLIFLGLVKFFTDFFRGDRELISNSISTNQLLGLGCLFFGIYIIYVQGRRSPKSDLLSISVFFLDSKARRSTLSKFYRSWYNLVVNFKINSGRFRRRFIIHSKAILRNLNVKSNPPQF